MFLTKYRNVYIKLMIRLMNSLLSEYYKSSGKTKTQLLQNLLSRNNCVLLIKGNIKPNKITVFLFYIFNGIFMR